MATACYPRNYSFVAVKPVSNQQDQAKQQQQDGHGKSKPAFGMHCHFCKYVFPYAATSQESILMSKVSNVSGPEAQTLYFCPSTLQAHERLNRLERLLPENRFVKVERLFEGYSASEDCETKFKAWLEKKRQAIWLEAARAKFARHNKVVCEEDYPKDLQKLPSPYRERSAASVVRKTTMGRDSRATPSTSYQQYRNDYGSESDE
jgi:hypothetical protein